MGKSRLLVLQNKIEELNRLIGFLEQLADEWETPSGLISTLNLALEEAITNIVFYAFDKGEEHEIKLTFSLDNEKLSVVIEDEGRPYDPTGNGDPDINLSVGERPIGGLGVFLIKQIMDKVDYCRDGNSNKLLLVKNLN